MAFENWHNPEQESVDPGLKEQQNQAQIDKEFDAVLKEYQNMPPQEQAEFIEAIANKDPHFRELYTQLKDFFWKNIQWLDEQLEAIEIQKLFEAEANKTGELLLSQSSFFENNENFSDYSDLLTEKEINGNKVSVLNNTVYEWYIRYSDNSEPLIKALAYKELSEVKQILDDSLHAISTRMQAAPENMPEARLFAFKQYSDKEEQILKDFTPNAVEFQKLLSTDAGKMLLSNTAFVSFENRLKSDILQQLWYTQQTENETTLNIENNTKWLLLNLWVIENKFEKRIQDFLENQWSLKARDYITWQNILHHDLPNQLEKAIWEEIKLYSFQVWEDLIKKNASIINQWGIFNLPIWNGENVRLDFWELWDISELNTQEILDLYRNNFDSIYRNNFWEIISDTIWEIWTSVKENPWKTSIDVSSVIFAWIWAVLASEWTWVVTAPLIAWPTFTVLDNGYRAWMYEVFDIQWWWKAWVWIEENDTHNDILRKKLFELWWNTALFWLFKVVGGLEAKFPKIDNQIASMSLKTPIEAVWFTYYSVVTENLQETIKNDGNMNEILNDFSEIPNMQALVKSFIYNLWFITAVKAWAIPAEKMIIAWYNKQLNTELQTLKEKWYTIMETWEWHVFYKGLNKVDNVQNKEFSTFVELNKKLNYISTEQYRKPESGRWWKSAYSTTLRETKFQNLEKYSKEAQSWKIAYALNDKIIWKSLTENWIWKKWDNIWKWLLEKSWFEKWEKIEPKTKFEKKAVRQMEKANELVFKEYKEWFKKVSEWKPINEVFPTLSDDLIQKIINIRKLDTKIREFNEEDFK